MIAPGRSQAPTPEPLKGEGRSVSLARPPRPGQQRWKHLAATVLLCLGAVAAAHADDWDELSPSQRRALAPLQSVWPGIGGTERTMWLEVAQRYRALAPAEQQRLQQRMNDWSRMTPSQRGQARLQFQEAGRWSATERQERWEAYKSLDPQARRVLAERWKFEAAAREREAGGELERPTKRNIFEQPRPSPEPPRTATPTAAAARAGATTRPLSRPKDTAPTHQQHGVPKIAATPSFVDPATLLPRRGPQAAAAVARPASGAPAAAQRETRAR